MSLRVALQIGPGGGLRTRGSSDPVLRLSGGCMGCLSVMTARAGRHLSQRAAQRQQQGEQ